MTSSLNGYGNEISTSVQDAERSMRKDNGASPALTSGRDNTEEPVLIPIIAMRSAGCPAISTTGRKRNKENIEISN